MIFTLLKISRDCQYELVRSEFRQFTLSLNSHHVPEAGVQGQSPLYTKAAIEAIGPRMFPTHEATGSSALAPGRFVELFQGLKFSPFQSPNNVKV